MQLAKSFVETKRGRLAYIRQGEGHGEKLIMVHGNASSGGFFAPLLPRLAERFDVIAPDLAGFGDSEPLPCMAETGLYDWAGDVDDMAVALGFERFTLLGWSLGGGVAMKYVTMHPEKVEKLVLVAPMSPYGFGGTRGTEGEMYSSNGWGCAGGFANPDFLKRLAEGDRGSEPTSPRTVMCGLFKNGFPFDKEWEELFLSELMKIKQGPENYPGAYIPTAEFPYVLPTKTGYNNALAPQYANVTDIVKISPKPEIVWIRGDSDTLVSDSSYADLAVLGMMGIVPGYPGAEVFPPQPMLGQTRAVLESYKANGGSYRELVLNDTGHGCILEKPEEFYAIML